jgi:hypothetical protein
MVIKLGDRIKFKSATRWSGKAATRVVNGFHNGCPTVRYSGWGKFIVRLEEVIEIVD